MSHFSSTMAVRKAEKAQVSKKASVVAVAVHVADGEEVNEKGNHGHHHEHDDADIVQVDPGEELDRF